MAKILVIGRVNLDRIWRLNAPLRSGGRTAYHGVETRFGGGGFSSSRVLAACGHHVAVLTSFADDAAGRGCRKALEELGVDTSFIEMRSGETVPVEVFLDPAGERTILGYVGRGAYYPDFPAADFDLIYVNAHRLNEQILAGLDRAPHVVSQFPLSRERHPARTLIASGSDVTASAEALWAEASGIAGPQLRHVIRTRGAGAVELIEETSNVDVGIEIAEGVVDTIGAGDFFAAGYVDGLMRGQSSVDAIRHGASIAGRWLRTAPARTPGDLELRGARPRAAALD
ncbi:PfkB family carbohydrate kinase [Terrarubrum flagellatum]|uniref:PfkB family carbohydrate kinase n=1 Tax=Terrirubrum flagellatum TaxID=2895980 RepID=UPI0031455F4D